MTRLFAVALALLALGAGPALGADRCAVADLEDEVFCPTCETTLDQSNAPVADQMRGLIRERAAAGRSCGEIKDELVEQFGEGVLAAPPKRGFGLLAWVLPLAGLGIGALAVGALAWRWSRSRAEAAAETASPQDAGSRLDPELERRVDEELARFE